MSAEVSVSTPGSISKLNPGMEVQGKVKRLEIYGAFVDIGLGQDALLHISQLGRPDVRNVEDVVKPDDEITAYVVKVDKDAGRVALSLVKPEALSWDLIQEGMHVTGAVVRIEDFGVFVDIGAEKPGMVHVSELAEGYVNSPSDVVKMGETVEARVIKVNRRKRRIDLSLKSDAVAEARYEVVDEDDEEVPTAMEAALRRAMAGRQDAESKRARNKKRGKGAGELEDILARTLKNHSA